MMPKLISFLAFALLVVFSSCEKLDELRTFEIKDQTEVSIPGQTAINLPLIIQSPEVQSSAEQSYKNNNTKADLVESASLSQLSLSILSPDSQDFDFLNEIHVYIKDKNGNEVLLASKENIPEDARKELELETSGANLKPFLKEESYTIRTEAKTDQLLDNDVEIKINMSFEVKAKVF